MDKTILDTAFKAETQAVRPVLQQIVQVKESEMSDHPERSLEYNRIRLEWNKANAALCRANEDIAMQEAYQREERHYRRLIELQKSSH
jgi:hypothetical protein